MSKPIRYMLYSTFAFTLMNAFAKYLDGFNPFQLVFFRSITAMLLCWIYLSVKGINMWGNQRKLLALRGIFGVLSLTTFFFAIQMMPFGSAVSLRYLAPIFATIFGVLILHEKVKPIQWLYFGMAFCGAVLLKGFDGRISPIGLGLILSSAVLIGFIYVIIRKIGKQDHPIVIINYFMMAGVLVGGVLAIPYWRMPVGTEWFFVGSIGIVGFIGQIFLTEAFQAEQASKIAPIMYIEVVFSLLIGLFWFGESQSLFSLFGIALIIGGMILNVLVKKA